MLGKLDSTTDSSLLYNRDRVRLLDSGEFWLSETPHVQSFLPDSSHGIYRNCVWGKFASQAKPDSTPFYVFSVHLEYKVEFLKERQARILLKEVQKIMSQSNGKEQVYIMGDFNTIAAAPALKPFREQHFANVLSDYSKLVSDNVQWSFHAYMGSRLENIFYTIPASLLFTVAHILKFDIPSAILPFDFKVDHIFARNVMQSDLAEIKVLNA